jgi:hypothetical protein
MILQQRITASHTRPLCVTASEKLEISLSPVLRLPFSQPLGASTYITRSRHDQMQQTEFLLIITLISWVSYSYITNRDFIIW